MAAPSGHASIPSTRDIVFIANLICSSVTSTAPPALSFYAARIKSSAKGVGIRIPGAIVFAFCQAVARS